IDALVLDGLEDRGECFLRRALGVGLEIGVNPLARRRLGLGTPTRSVSEGTLTQARSASDGTDHQRQQGGNDNAHAQASFRKDRFFAKAAATRFSFFNPRPRGPPRRTMLDIDSQPPNWDAPR